MEHARSYSDPYANVNNGSPVAVSDARKSQRDLQRSGVNKSGASYVELLERKRAAKKDLVHPPIEIKNSVLNRPPFAQSKKNVEQVDIEHARDVATAARKAAVYRKMATQPWHSDRAEGSVLTIWEQGHIADRGRGRPASAPVDNLIGGRERASITLPTQHGGISSRSLVPPSAVRERRGVLNPLTQQYSQAPDVAYVAARQHSFDARNGFGNCGKGRAGPEADASRRGYDPILGRMRGAAGPDAQDPLPQPAGPAQPGLPAERPPGRRGEAVRAGDSWGSYNPLLHAWTEPPRDVRFRDQEELTDRRAGIHGGCKVRVDPGPSQGVYNPVTNVWVVPPANARIIGGMAFAPARVFASPVNARRR
ncbi:hypothetical protein FOA52_004535 [Chlamydomonas sp. UWO 241]|nr:hypothetical protein FOA52_004535 [Chlamydomonas sp. UWO 241]